MKRKINLCCFIIFMVLIVVLCGCDKRQKLYGFNHEYEFYQNHCVEMTDLIVDNGNGTAMLVVNLKSPKVQIKCYKPVLHFPLGEKSITFDKELTLQVNGLECFEISGEFSDFKYIFKDDSFKEFTSENCETLKNASIDLEFEGAPELYGSWGPFVLFDLVIKFNEI